jgi:hypothetical protein
VSSSLVGLMCFTCGSSAGCQNAWARMGVRGFFTPRAASPPYSGSRRGDGLIISTIIFCPLSQQTLVSRAGGTAQHAIPFHYRPLLRLLTPWRSRIASRDVATNANEVIDRVPTMTFACLGSSAAERAITA